MKMTRITIKVKKDLKEQFLAWVSKFNISKDLFLRNQLPRELEYLSELPENSEIGRRINSTLGAGTERLSISLPKTLVTKMESLCKAKGLHRDIFIDYYLDYLVHGDGEYEVASPLTKVEEILDNPRNEYKTEKFGNPYRHLYWTKESAMGFLKL